MYDSCRLKSLCFAGRVRPRGHPEAAFDPAQSAGQEASPRSNSLKRVLEWFEAGAGKPAREARKHDSAGFPGVPSPGQHERHKRTRLGAPRSIPPPASAQRSCSISGTPDMRGLAPSRIGSPILIWPATGIRTRRVPPPSRIVKTTRRGARFKSSGWRTRLQSSASGAVARRSQNSAPSIEVTGASACATAASEVSF